jgi:HTH-type transcriptional regulator, transcriptional repressor of NAD biosynthesis genes
MEKTTKMTKAFVIGKFLPFHNGHVEMIKFALTKCDILTVLVCCSDQELVSCAIRKAWIESTFPEHLNLEVRSFSYLESEFPNTSVSSKLVSEIWSVALRREFPDYSLVVSSEPYGDYIAALMNIEHISFDQPRQLIPISGTIIRANLFSNWHFLPNSVKPYFAVKVIILGTESTGKSTLTEKLAAHYNCRFVAEAGRDLIPNSNSFSIEDLELVAIEHAKRITETDLQQHPLVIIDTDIHITKSYARFVFDKELEVIADIYNANKGTIYFYLNNDVSFVQDGSRLDENYRNLLDHSHRAVLQKHAIDFIEVRGSYAERFEKITSEIDELLKSKQVYDANL